MWHGWNGRSWLGGTKPNRTYLVDGILKDGVLHQAKSCLYHAPNVRRWALWPRLVALWQGQVALRHKWMVKMSQGLTKIQHTPSWAINSYGSWGLLIRRAMLLASETHFLLNTRAYKWCLFFKYMIVKLVDWPFFFGQGNAPYIVQNLNKLFIHFIKIVWKSQKLYQY